MFSGIFREPGIVGTWKGDTGIIEFKGSGKCVINGEKKGFRSISDAQVILIDNCGCKKVSYMMSFDKQSMYFDNKKYTRISQSGAESSIMELLL